MAKGAQVTQRRANPLAIWAGKWGVFLPSVVFAVVGIVCFAQGRYRVAADYFLLGFVGPVLILVWQLLLALLLLVVFRSGQRFTHAFGLIVGAYLCGSPFARLSAADFATEFWFKFPIGLFLLMVWIGMWRAERHCVHVAENTSPATRA